MKRTTWNAALSAMFAALILLAAAFAQENGQPIKSDDLPIVAQRICPVSGGDLRAMGGPIKAKSGDMTILLCCKACLGKPVSKENWAKVTANLAAAQGRCPVMNRPLPKNATSTVANGRMIFVCCPPCTKKIQANPEKYLAAVDGMLREHLSELPTK